MAYNNADLAVTLPNTQPALGQVMQNAIGLAERQQARQDNLDERRYESEQRNALARQNKLQANATANWNDIGKLESEYKPLDTITYEATNKAVKNIYDILKQNTNLDPRSFDELKHNLVSEFLPTYKKMELEKQDAKDQTSNFTKALPSADLQSVKEVVDNQFKNRFLNADGSFKKPNEVSGTFDYTSALNDPSKLSWVVKDTSALPKFFDTIKTTPINGGELVGKNGKTHSVNWSGYNTKYSTPVYADENGVPQIETSSKEVPLKDGKSMKIASDVLRDDMNSNPDVRAAFEISWNNYKNEKKLNNLSQAENDLMKEKYRLDYADSQLKRLQNVNKHQKEVSPVIKINNGKEDKNYTQNFVSRFVDATKNGTADDIVNVGRELFTGNGSSVFENIKVNKDNKGISIYYRDKEFGLPSEEVKVLKLNPNDKNFPYELAGAYQRLTGSDTKLEKAIFSGKGVGIDKNTKKNTPYSADIEAKINAVIESNKGATREQVINALKKAGKIK
jgi:hypothetical protein